MKCPKCNSTHIFISDEGGGTTFRRCLRCQTEWIATSSQDNNHNEHEREETKKRQ